MKTRKEKGPNSKGKILKKIHTAVDTVTNVVDTVNDAVFTPPPPPTITPPPPPPTPETETETETETPVVDPQQVELRRQAKMVKAGNVNPAQAEYFRQQNKELFMDKERKGAIPTNIYNKLEEITGVNPVSNRRNDKMNELFGGLYGSEESRGF